MNNRVHRICCGLVLLGSVPWGVFAQEQLVPEQFISGQSIPEQSIPEHGATTTQPGPASSLAPEAGTRQNRDNDASLSLQTTITGNQEQPRVLYILPWQSPASPDLDINMLDSQHDAVFGHLEREELRRELEAAGAYDQ